MSLYDNDPRISLQDVDCWRTTGGRYAVAGIGSAWDIYDLHVSEDQPINERGFDTADEAIEALLGEPRSSGFQPGESVMATYENGTVVLEAVVTRVAGDEVYVVCRDAFSEDQLSVAQVRFLEPSC